MKLYFKYGKIKLGILLSFLLSFSFIYMPYVNQTYYYYFNVLVRIIVTWYIFMNFKWIQKSKFKIGCYIYIVYGAIIIISNIVNGTLEQIVIVNVLLNTIIFPFFIIQHGKGNLYSALKAFVFSFIVQIIINDFLMIVFGNVFTGDGISNTFWLGNKFNVGYAHLLCLIFFYILKNKTKFFNIKVAILTAYTLIVSIYVNCDTVIIANVLLIVLLMFRKKTEAFMSNKIAVLIFMLLCALILVFSDVATSGIISNFMKSVFSDDGTMTGRLPIYTVLPIIIMQKFVWGYGYNNLVVYHATGAYNAQNGMLEIVVNYGILAAVCFGIIILYSCKKGKTFEHYVLLSIVWIFIFLSSIEVTYGIQMILYMSLLAVLSQDTK